MASSYDRIVEKFLTKNKETTDFVEDFPNFLNMAAITRHIFSIDRGNGTVGVKLVCRFGEKPEEKPEEGAPDTFWEVLFHEGVAQNPVREIVSSFCEGHLERVWGKPKICPTFNCKKDGVSYRFDNVVRQSVFAKHSDIIEAEVKRVQGLATAYMAKEEFLEQKQAHLERGGIDEIIAAMERFESVSEDVVRDAVEEYLAKRVVNE